MRYEIRPCRLADLRQLAMTMRAEDRGEIDAAGLLPRHLLPRLWRASLDPKVAYVDGEVAAAWGDAAAVLARHGSMWMFTAPPVERVPLAFFREGRAEIQRRLIVRASLAADVRADYAKAIRFFSLLGFEVGEAFPAGPHRVLYRRMTIRATPGLGLGRIAAAASVPGASEAAMAQIASVNAAAETAKHLVQVVLRNRRHVEMREAV